tara:strand:- start:304 stop:576 length:273 start_codon:yes stop_codon:yes gene_type:complete
MIDRRPGWSLNGDPMLRWKDKTELTLAVTTRGVKIPYPAALPGCDLTKRERELLERRGWVPFEGTYYCPAVRTNGTLDRLKRHAAARKAD